jgi:ubiquinol-cytochrome c reductase iron-sulfur subunit
VKLFTLFGLGLATIPFIRSLVPGFEEDLTMEVDFSSLGIDEFRIVEWLGRRIVIYRRTLESISLVENVAEGALKDPQSKLSKQPGFATNSYRSLRKDILVAYLNCTHLGCETACSKSESDPLVGFQCPCHQSNYDHAGRVLAEQPAPFNLEVPNYKYVANNVIQFFPAKA